MFHLLDAATDPVSNIWLQYGILGAVVIALSAAYLRLEKRIDTVEARHKDERGEWLTAIRTLFDRQESTNRDLSNKQDATQRDTNATIRETGSIIQGMEKL